jgi:hypothetical protein
MNRIFTTFAAIASLTACSEGFDATAEGIQSAGAAGEDTPADVSPAPSLDIDPDGDPDAPQDDVDGNGNGASAPDEPEWRPAFLPAGAYWMQYGEVFRQPDGGGIQPGHRDIVFAPRIDGAVMLYGYAPVETNLERLRAVGETSFTSPDGDCTETLSFDAVGFHEGEEAFALDIIEIIDVVGADCPELGMGDERTDRFEYLASFTFVPPTEEPGGGKDGDPADDGAGNGDSPEADPTDGGVSL